MTTRLAWTTILAVLSPALAFAQIEIRKHTGMAPSSTTLGRDACGVGDLNGDGVSDYALSMPDAAGQLGGFRVYSGATGAMISNVIGSFGANQLGVAIDGPGDLDGDGAIDIVATHVGGSGALRAYKLIGAVGILWERTGDSFGVGAKVGFSVASAGDLDNDGFTDVVLGVSDATVRGLAGKTGTEIVNVTGVAGSGFGIALDAGADIDNDGFRDILIGAPRQDVGTLIRAGRVVIATGNTGAVIGQIDGTIEGAELGASVGFGGDVDNDGRADFAAITRYENNPEFIFSSEGALRGYSSATLSPLWTFRGRGQNSMQTSELDFSHDLDGDGSTDVLVGFANESVLVAGMARVLSGVDGVVRSAIVETDPFPNVFGVSVAGIGDITNDGRSDFVVGFGPGHTSTAGGAYVYGSVPCSGFALNFGGSVPGSGIGCTGEVGLQCGLAPPLDPSNFTAEGCFSSNGRAMLHLQGGLSTANLLIVGANPTLLPLPGGCGLLVAPLFPTLVMPSPWPNYLPIEFPMNLPSGSVYLQMVSYKDNSPLFDCLRVATSAGLFIAFP